MGDVIPGPVRQMQTPQLTTPRATGRGDQAIAGAAKEIGQTVFNHAQVMQEEHDLAMVQDSATEFRGETRIKLSEMLARQGKDSFGSIEEYSEHYRKLSGQYNQKLGNRNQQEKFDKFIISRREADLDSLSSHQAREHRRHLTNVLDGVVVDAISEVATADAMAMGRIVDDSIARVGDALENAKHGSDNSAEMAKYAAKIKMTAIDKALSQDPLIARGLLQEWAKDLGDAYPKAAIIVEKHATFAEAQMHANEQGPDEDPFDSMREYVDGKELNREVEDYVLGQINAQEREFDIREQKARDERRLNTQNAFWNSMIENNYGTARSLAENMRTEDGTFTEGERYNLIAAAENGLAAKNNDLAETKLTNLVHHNKTITKNQIMAYEEWGKLDAGGMTRISNLIKKENETPSNYGPALTRIKSAFDIQYPNDKIQFLPFEQFFLGEVRKLEEKNNGKPITHEDALALGEALLTPPKEPGAIYGYNKGDSQWETEMERLEEAKEQAADDREAAEAREPKKMKYGREIKNEFEGYLNQIPDVVQQEIIMMYIREGKKATAETVWKSYLNNPDYKEDAERILSGE